MKKNILILSLLLLALFVFGAFTIKKNSIPSVKGKRVLIYTKNGKGYVHKNIPSSVAALKEICAGLKVSADVSDNPTDFTSENLKKYDALIFSNTNNEIFDTDQQKKALQDYIRGGGGFVGIHSACGSERSWPWFWAMLGGKFVRHAPHQEYVVIVTDPNNPSTYFLPERWTVNDECYYCKELNPDIHVLLSADLTTVKDENMDKYPDETFGHQFTLCWCHSFDGGREWYTALGHDAETYNTPLFRQHLEGGILWALGIDHLK